MKNALLSVIMLALCLVGCVHDSTKIEDSDQSLGEIKKAVVSVIGDPRKLSENQREFTSQYTNKDHLKSRVYYVVTILGSRRPYDIEIRAFSEIKSGNTYEQNGEDSEAAKKILRDIQAKLHQSRDGRNLIDDFRAF